MEKNISTAAEQTETAEVKKNQKIIELARPYKFDDKEYTEIDLSGLDGLTIKDAVLIIKKLYNEGELAAMITPETATAYTDALAAACRTRYSDPYCFSPAEYGIVIGMNPP